MNLIDRIPDGVLDIPHNRGNIYWSDVFRSWHMFQLWCACAIGLAAVPWNRIVVGRNICRWKQ